MIGSQEPVPGLELERQSATPFGVVFDRARRKLEATDEAHQMPRGANFRSRQITTPSNSKVQVARRPDARLGEVDLGDQAMHDRHHQREASDGPIGE